MFNPLGSFVATAPLNGGALAEARVFPAALPQVPRGALQRIYGHWTVGHYGQNFNDYNAAVRYDGTRFYLDSGGDVGTGLGDPRDNAIGVNDNEPHPHTYHRNTGGFGIATDDMVFASVHDFGPEPLTLLTLEYLCAGIGAVAKAYGIDLLGLSTRAPYAGEPTFLTHAEAADHPGVPPQYAPYGPKSTWERWDLLTFVPIPAGVTFNDASICGNALRQRSHLYKGAL